MNRNRLLLIGLLALAIAGFASFTIYRALRIAIASTGGKQTTAIVAAGDLQVGQRLEEKDLRLVKLPASDLPQGVYQKSSDLVGRGVLQPISRNELILSSKIASGEAGAGLPALIPEGMRAVSVKVNDVIAVAGFVVPGTRVDVLLTGNPDEKNEKPNVRTTTVLQNVQVLAAGQKLQKSETGEAQTVPVITLLVNPDDAQKLALASQEGRIQLSLRNPVDTKAEKPAVVRNIALYDGPTPPQKKVATSKVVKTAKAPVPPPVTIYTVEMIRGDKRDVAKF